MHCINACFFQPEIFIAVKYEDPVGLVLYRLGIKLDKGTVIDPGNIGYPAGFACHGCYREVVETKDMCISAFKKLLCNGQSELFASLGVFSGLRKRKDHHFISFFY